MERIITKIAADFKRDAEEFLSKSRKDIRSAEEFFVPRIGKMATELLAALYEAADQLPAVPTHVFLQAGAVQK